LILAAPPRNPGIFVDGDPNATFRVRRRRRKGQMEYVFLLKVKHPTMPDAAGGPVPVTITYDLGGLLSRSAVNLRPKRRGAVLRFP
jgi:hypothetical protein